MIYTHIYTHIYIYIYIYEKWVDLSIAMLNYQRLLGKPTKSNHQRPRSPLRRCGRGRRPRGRCGAGCSALRAGGGGIGGAPSTKRVGGDLSVSWSEALVGYIYWWYMMIYILIYIYIYWEFYNDDIYIYTDPLTLCMLWLYIYNYIYICWYCKIICVMYVMVIKRCTHPRLDTMWFLHDFNNFFGPGASAPLQSFGAVASFRKHWIYGFPTKQKNHI